MKNALLFGSLLTSTFALAWGTALEACSSSSSSATTTVDAAPEAATDAPVDRAPVKSGTPTYHRTTATTCGKTRPVGRAGDAGTDAGMDPCLVDDDCVAGKNGRCIFGEAAGMGSCSYDECYADSDCPSGDVCMCRDAEDIIPDLEFVPGVSKPTNTVCAAAQCTQDNDCGSGNFCSPSYDPSTHKFTFQCHAPADECTNDQDCVCPNGTQSDLCFFDPAKNHWACYLQDCR